MAALQFNEVKKLPQLSKVAVPEALHKSLKHIFAGIDSGVWLVGGTALAGYYAEHRRSDDLDLFCADTTTFKATVLAAKSLTKLNAKLNEERSTPNFYHALVNLYHHKFTIDVVLDEFLHTIGHAEKDKDGIMAADILTLFTMKVSTLVSRVSEKDLFDLVWLFERLKSYSMVDIVTLGQKIDGGITAETLIYSIQAARLRAEACHFLLPGDKRTPKQIYEIIQNFKNRLVDELLNFEKSAPISKTAQKLKSATHVYKKIIGGKF